MSDRGGTALPYGFGGPVSSPRELVSKHERVLRLPDEAIVDGPVRRVPEGEYDLIQTRITESLGRVEGVLEQVADRLTPAGSCVLEIENSQSPRALRRVLEGRPSSMDPHGSLSDPAQRMSLLRVLTAAEDAGLLLRDCVAVPAGDEDLGPDFARRFFESGICPVDYVHGAPPWKHWIVCEKVRAMAGTVLVGSGDERDQQTTVRCLRGFLPHDWEVLCCSGSGEVAAFNRSVPQSRGELLWLIRAGATADARLFGNLLAGAALSPAAPGLEGELSHPGDVSGLMMSKRDLLFAGRLPERWINPQVAYEDWSMLLQAVVGRPLAAQGGFTTPPPPAVDLPVMKSEGREMLEVWSARGGGASRSGGAPGEEGHSGDLQGTPRISLCMITRDEEQFLGDCLKSAAAAVDEIVVVDTGSTDRTVEIAESHGARVLHVPWTDDFSAPRNRALEAATGDWILVLDADETLQEGACERIRELVHNPRISGYHMLFTNRYTGGKTLGVLMVRLFRNLPGIRFDKRIHEQVTMSLAQASAPLAMKLGVADVEVVHEGYTDDLMSSRNKNERNERLFLLQLQDEPRDIYTLYKYGDFLRRIPSRSADARVFLDRALELIFNAVPTAQRELPYAAEVAALCALEHAREGRNDRAAEIIDRALRELTPTPNLFYIAASVALALSRNDEAIACYRRCLAYAGAVLVVPIQEGITGHVSITGIAQAWLQKGDHVKAQRLLEQAIAMSPEYDVSHMVLSRLHCAKGDVESALKVLTDYLAINPNSAGACHQATLLLERLGLGNQARRMGERALRIMEEGAMEYESKNLKRTLATLC